MLPGEFSLRPYRHDLTSLALTGRRAGYRRRGSPLFLFFGPGVQQAAEQEELAEVVSVVVKEQNGFGSQ